VNNKWHPDDHGTHNREKGKNAGEKSPKSPFFHTKDEITQRGSKTLYNRNKRYPQSIGFNNTLGLGSKHVDIFLPQRDQAVKHTFDLAAIGKHIKQYKQ